MALAEARVMSVNGLAEFIETERLTIVKEWEVFARTLLPGARGLPRIDLRDHADEILTAIIHDMRSRQTPSEQAEKSKGRGDAQRMAEIGQLHAVLRIENGFKLSQLVAEYRALRASVLRLWEKAGEKAGGDPGGLTRFNEAIDEALAEAVDSFMKTTEHFRDQSLGILGHDLRNPLSGIIMGASMLSNADLDDGSIKLAARILSSARRMNRMIDDLLDLTRTRFGDRIPVVLSPIDLAPVCRQVVAELEGLRPVGDLRLECKGDLRGEWDSDRIAQVLSNLVRNAILHGSSSGPINVLADGEGEAVTLSVHNEGPSIPLSSQRGIFDPMVHHDRNGQKPGLGLGLYIGSQVALAHGGTVDVTSTDADGTTFRVHLPRHLGAARTTNPPVSEAKPSSESLVSAHEPYAA